MTRADADAGRVRRTGPAVPATVARGDVRRSVDATELPSVRDPAYESRVSPSLHRGEGPPYPSAVPPKVAPTSECRRAMVDGGRPTGAPWRRGAPVNVDETRVLSTECPRTGRAEAGRMRRAPGRGDLRADAGLYTVRTVAEVGRRECAERAMRSRVEW